MAVDIVSLEEDCPLKIAVPLGPLKIQDNAAAVLNGVTVYLPLAIPEWDATKTNNVFIVDSVMLFCDSNFGVGQEVELDVFKASAPAAAGTSIWTTKPKLGNGANAWDVSTTAHAGVTVGVLDPTEVDVAAGEALVAAFAFTNGGATLGNVGCIGYGHWKNQRNQ